MAKPEYEIVVYREADALPQEAEELFKKELGDSRGVIAGPEGKRWRFACVCAVTSEGQVLGGVHFDMGPINGGPLAHQTVAILEYVYVRPEHRRRGIAAALLDRAVETARREGCAHMRCNSRWDNLAEIALYKKCGFALADISGPGEGGQYFTVKPL